MMNYIIVDVSELNKVDYNLISEDSFETLRFNNDNTKTILSWIGEQPSFVNDLMSKSQVYTNQEIIELLKNDEWIPQSLSGTTIN